MFGVENFFLFLAMGILLNITPGGDTIYILSRTVTQGKKAGMMSVLGIVSGAAVHTLLAAFGLSIILMKSAMIFNMVKWAGAGYLIYLGWKTIRSGAGEPFELDNKPKAHIIKIFTQGFLTNLLNPKVALFYLAFLPQFISPSNHFGPLPFLILGFTFIVTGTLWCLALVQLSSSMTKKFQSTKIGKYSNKILGVIYISLGLSILRVTLPSRA
ncbi:LysE family translocator [Paenibacillus sp. P25]|nr:LysE family translocator [Paenibacillus sp. P25]